MSWRRRKPDPDAAATLAARTRLVSRGCEADLAAMAADHLGDNGKSEPAPGLVSPRLAEALEHTWRQRIGTPSPSSQTPSSALRSRRGGLRLKPAGQPDPTGAVRQRMIEQVAHPVAQIVDAV